MGKLENRLDRLERHFARIGSSKRHELLFVEVGETVEGARAQKSPEGVTDDVCLLTIQFV